MEAIRRIIAVLRRPAWTSGAPPYGLGTSGPRGCLLGEQPS